MYIHPSLTISGIGVKFVGTQVWTVGGAKLIVTLKGIFLNEVL